MQLKLVALRSTFSICGGGLCCSVPVGVAVYEPVRVCWIEFQALSRGKNYRSGLFMMDGAPRDELCVFVCGLFMCLSLSLSLLRHGLSAIIKLMSFGTGDENLDSVLFRSL